MTCAAGRTDKGHGAVKQRLPCLFETLFTNPGKFSILI